MLRYQVTITIANEDYSWYTDLDGLLRLLNRLPQVTWQLAT